MIFKETVLKGAYLIELEKNEDERGSFTRYFCQKEFEAHNLKLPIKQSNISYNKKRGTLRGMHYQVAPYAESKLVTCVSGAIYDVIIDLRLDSSTYCKWFSIKLTAQNYISLYVPEGFAHGFQTLADDTIVLYQMSELYNPKSSQGIRWDDPEFKISWPIQEMILSKRDLSYPLYKNNSQGGID